MSDIQAKGAKRSYLVGSICRVEQGMEIANGDRRGFLDSALLDGILYLRFFNGTTLSQTGTRLDGNMMFNMTQTAFFTPLSGSLR